MRAIILVCNCFPKLTFYIIIGCLTHELQINFAPSIISKNPLWLTFLSCNTQRQSVGACLTLLERHQKVIGRTILAYTLPLTFLISVLGNRCLILSWNLEEQRQDRSMRRFGKCPLVSSKPIGYCAGSRNTPVFLRMLLAAVWEELIELRKPWL